MNSKPAPPGANHNGEIHPSMTLHQWYMGQCLAGLMANPNVVGFNSMSGWSLVNCDCEDIAAFCRTQAEEMEKKHANI